jgi:hypothetical protein
MFTCLDVIRSASRALIDADHVRWTLPELLDHINDAVRAIVVAKPNARTETVTLTLQQGTLQTLPDEYTILSRVTRNLTQAHSSPGGPVGGPAIRMVSGRELMDSFFPGWQSDTTLFSSLVQHVIYDNADLRQFYVIPGNTGTGMIEAIVGVMPEAIAPGGDPNTEATYNIPVDIPDIYRTPVVDYVLFRSFSKDQGVPASEARAQKHLQAFQMALQITTEAQTIISAAAAARGTT